MIQISISSGCLVWEVGTLPSNSRPAGVSGSGVRVYTSMVMVQEQESCTL